MDEFELYEIASWNPPFWKTGETRGWAPKHTNMFIDLSKNPHPMATNILYANYNLLDATFATWFYMNKDTTFLYEKLSSRFVILYNHYSNISYYRLTTMKEDLITLTRSCLWKFRHNISYICANYPLSEFPEAIFFEDLNWFSLAENKHKCVMDFMKAHRDQIHWVNLSRNSSDPAVDFMLEEFANGREIEWWTASVNTNERLIAHFKNVKNELSVYSLCRNTSSTVIRLLLENPELYEKISWERFCENSNDLAVDHIIEIYETNKKDKRLVWEVLCLNVNPRIFSILRENKEKVDWNEFYRNPNCFQYNYEKMRERFSPLKREIEDIFLRPDNVMAKIENERNMDETDFDTIARLDF
jgi:hypothetical protein